MKQLLRVFIVDDEYQSRLVLVKLLSHHFPAIQIAGQAGAVEEAIESINTLQPDIIFMDVQLQGDTGFDVLDKITGFPHAIIFTTAHPEYAVKAFRYSATDYLVKPIDAQELVTATQKAIDTLCRQPANAQPKFADKIAVPTAEGLSFVRVKDIVYCQGQVNYTILYLVNGQKITSSQTLKVYENMLVDQHFFRAHKSFLINLQHVETYYRGEGGTAVMSNGHQVEIARRSKGDFLNLFKA